MNKEGVKRRAVFFDRDGVITKAVERFQDGEMTHTAPFTLEEFEVFPDAREAIRAVRKAGVLAICVTNQPDKAYGRMTSEVFDELARRTRELGFDDVFICPHGRSEGCECKKPKPGMLHEAALKWDIDLSKSVIIGDTASDTGAGKAAGCRTIIIQHKYNKKDWGDADVIVSSLASAVTSAISMSEK